ncbi:disulfide bond formation protein B [Pseudomonas sp. 14P_8.1_Bac3]|uniref:disulfide bond formation protein B n=1 Tax=Pseudomonas sp. 14P_8.1_Bac3 TaxID=2971621 RepID=UPI0021C6E3FC|nr:disulfide bond formation protein B [Pseudomonas sp. 14P_8.1_Bac3]MCU1762522.1 disulfide bond formation protein B [Pseudomonas sp. 14P_8.1_Bac3]
MSLACSRSLFFMVFVAGALALGISYYLEYTIGLPPCGMCLLQRVCLALFTAVCLMASVHGPERLGSSLYWLLGVLCSLAGTVTAWRQVLWQGEALQHLSTCSANLADLLASNPWIYAVQQLFNGTADCEHVSWTLFDLSPPEWSLLFFVAMTSVGVYQLLRLLGIALRRPLSGDSSHPALAGD